MQVPFIQNLFYIQPILDIETVEYNFIARAINSRSGWCQFLFFNEWLVPTFFDNFHCILLVILAQVVRAS